MSTSFPKLFLCLLAGLLWISAAAQTLSLKVIQTTDIHGSIEQGKFGRIAALIRQETASAGGPEKTVLADCGDLMQGSFPMTLDSGAVMIPALNLLAYDIFIPGNHDFEFGTGPLLRSLKQFRGTACALNLDWKEAPLRRWTLLKKNGLDIAVIGMTFPSLDSLVSAEQLSPAILLDAEKEMAKIIPEVMDAKPALIILAVHAGEYTPVSPRLSLTQLVRKYPQIDLVLGGHTHQDIPGKTLGGSSWFLQAPPHSGGIAVADILYDPRERKILSLQSRLVLPDPAAPPLPEMENLFSDLLRRAARKGSEQIARLPFALGPLSGTEKSNRQTELFADAIRGYTGAAIVFHGVSGKFEQPPGPLDRRRLFSMVPHEDRIGVMKLTPEECRLVIEEQLAKKRSGMFQSPSGVDYAPGRGGLLKGPLRLKGEDKDWTDEKRTVACAFTSFALAGAGGRFPLLRSLAKMHPVESYPDLIRSVLENHLQKNDPIQPRPAERK